MAALMKRVVKIEGPFNKNDELVDILVPGEAYYYLGTPNRDMDDAELLTMKWAYKIDNGTITPFLKSKYSKLKGKSKMSGMLPPDIAANSATVYAYFNRPSDDISMRKVVQKAAVKPATPAPAPAPVVPAVAPTGPGILNEMKALVDRNIPYSQTGERAKLSPEGLKNLDCSETVGIYLHKLGVMPTLVAIHTGLMGSESDFRKAIGSENIDFVPASKDPGFKPKRGDIFVWRKGVGHTGIVFNYDAAKDLVTILEAIGNVGSADEATNRTNGGTAQKGCSRTAVYKRAGKALNAHGGWIGYYRPKNYDKNL
jgi:hypothetical protein